MMKLARADGESLQALQSRSAGGRDVSAAVTEILNEVRRGGDAAVLAYTRRLDRADLSALEVSAAELEEAMGLVEPQFLQVLAEAAENIRAFHRRQLRSGFELREENGVVLGQKLTPIARVGLYVPGGTAAYPSTVLMDSIPAKLAGCRELCMVTPPLPDGKVHPAILAAARLAGVDRVFKCGGAQAVAALAYGTETIPAVDKIVGPGNAYVAEAKRQVSGLVGIDMIAGPSEILVIADGKTDPAFAAADLLSQAEHDRNAAAILITDDEDFAVRVQAEVERQLALLPRREIAAASIAANGCILLAESMEAAVAFSNRLAPEHLELCVDEPFALLPLVENAGSVFLGRYCPEVLGDYLAGTNHTLPTMGTARFSSPLSVDDFVKKTQYICYSREALAEAAPKLACFAEKEGLSAHARSASIRFQEVP